MRGRGDRQSLCHIARPARSTSGSRTRTLRTLDWRPLGPPSRQAEIRRAAVVPRNRTRVMPATVPGTPSGPGTAAPEPPAGCAGSAHSALHSRRNGSAAAACWGVAHGGVGTAPVRRPLPALVRARAGRRVTGPARRARRARLGVGRVHDPRRPARPRRARGDSRGRRHRARGDPGGADRHAGARDPVRDPAAHPRRLPARRSARRDLPRVHERPGRPLRRRGHRPGGRRLARPGRHCGCVRGRSARDARRAALARRPLHRPERRSDRLGAPGRAPPGAPRPRPALDGRDASGVSPGRPAHDVRAAAARRLGRLRGRARPALHHRGGLVQHPERGGRRARFRSRRARRRASPPARSRARSNAMPARSPRRTSGTPGRRTARSTGSS